MTNTRLTLLAAMLAATPVLAQQPAARVASSARTDTALALDSVPAPKKPDSTVAAPKAPRLPRYEAPAIEIQHIRAPDQRGLNVYESPTEETVPFTGFRLSWGGAFTQQFQNLTHSNTAAPRLVAAPARNRPRRLTRFCSCFSGPEADASPSVCEVSSLIAIVSSLNP